LVIFFQVYTEELATDFPKDNAHYFIQLQSADGLEIWSSDGCSKHAGSIYHVLQASAVYLSYLSTKLKLPKLSVSQFDFEIFWFSAGPWKETMADSRDVPGKWRLWLCEKA
jgi:hypothetical protein